VMQHVSRDNDNCLVYNLYSSPKISTTLVVIPFWDPKLSVHTEVPLAPEGRVSRRVTPAILIRNTWDAVDGHRRPTNQDSDFPLNLTVTATMRPVGFNATLEY